MDIETGGPEAGPDGMTAPAPGSGAAAERISLLRVPLDIVPQEQFPGIVMDLLRTRGGGNIVLLSLWDLLKARRNGEYRDYVQGAALVLPISKSLVTGARFLTGKSPVRYMPFDFVVSLLTVLERREYSLYLLGGSGPVLEKTEKNIRQTFPRIRIVGRAPGGFRRQGEANLLKAIHKAAPSLLLAAKGVRGGERWIARSYPHLSPGLRLWCSDLFDVFAEQRRRPSRAVFDRGLEWAGYCFARPWKFLRIFPWFHYRILLIVYRLFFQGKAREQEPVRTPQGV